MKDKKNKSQEQFPQKLLVEGSNDFHVVCQLCEQFKINENFNIEPAGNIEKLISSLPLHVRSSDIKTVGVLVDADDNPEKRVASIQKALRELDSNVILKLQEGGLITYILDERIKFGLWVMPNNRDKGMLEDFFIEIIPENDDLLPIVSEHLDRIESEGKNRYKAPLHRKKAEVHSWLAVQETPGMPMGKTIGVRMSPTDKANCQEFAKWLQTLFEEN